MTFAPQLKIIRQQVEDALSKGAHLLYGPKPQDWPQREGLHLTPIILTNVTHDMKVMQEETFGPIITIHPFHDEQEAIRLEPRFKKSETGRRCPPIGRSRHQRCNSLCSQSPSPLWWCKKKWDWKIPWGNRFTDFLS